MNPNPVKFRQEIIEAITGEIRSEDVSENNILSLYPSLRVRDKAKIIELMRVGLAKQSIARKLGYSEIYIGVIVKEIIREDFPDLVIYKYKTERSDGLFQKTSPSFEDLQYYLIGEFILTKTYLGLEMKDIMALFKTTDNPTGISDRMFREVCKRVLGGHFTAVRDVVREAIITMVILDKNPQTLQDIIDDPRYFGSLKNLQIKFVELFKINDYYVELALGRGILFEDIDILNIAICGPHLHNFYKEGYSNKQILSEFNDVFTLDDIERLTDAIWGFTPDEARRIFAIKLLS